MREKNPLDRHATGANDVLSYALFVRDFFLSFLWIGGFQQAVSLTSPGPRLIRRSFHTVAFQVATFIMLPNTTVHVLMMVALNEDSSCCP